MRFLHYRRNKELHWRFIMFFSCTPRWLCQKLCDTLLHRGFQNGILTGVSAYRKTDRKLQSFVTHSGGKISSLLVDDLELGKTSMNIFSSLERFHEINPGGFRMGSASWPTGFCTLACIATPVQSGNRFAVAIPDRMGWGLPFVLFLV